MNYRRCCGSEKEGAVLKRKFYWIAAAVLAVFASVACVSFENPSRRTAHEHARPDRTHVRCYEPPPGVVPAATSWPPNAPWL